MSSETEPTTIEQETVLAAELKVAAMRTSLFLIQTLRAELEENSP